MNDDELDFPPEKDVRFQWFHANFEAEHPYALSLLKGHLLCEELLGEIVASVCKQPEVLANSRLGFWDKLQLSRAICGVDSQVWVSLRHLNFARNGLAHGVALEELEKRIDKFIRSAANGMSWAKQDLDRARKLHFAIYSVNGGLAAITNAQAKRKGV